MDQQQNGTVAEDFPGYDQLRLLGVPRNMLGELHGLLQEGVLLEVPEGCSVWEVLNRELGLEQEFVERRIQTIFLNSKPVDSLEKSYVREGDTIAISAAMPGLVGAVMRRGGELSSLRSGISACPEDGPCENPSCKAQVRVKFFNLLLAEIGDELLQEGVLVQDARLQELLSSLPESFWEASQGIEIKGHKLDMRKYSLEIPQLGKLLLFSVVLAEEEDVCA